MQMLFPFASQGGRLLHLFSFAFFLHLSSLQFVQVCVTCTILTGDGGANAFICIAFFAVSTCIPPPPPTPA